MFSRSTFVGAILSVLSTTAFAADLPAMQEAPVFTWTGFYVGVNGGGVFGQVDNAHEVPGGGRGISYSMDGGFAGGTIGFNYQLSPTWVVGLEGDGDWADGSGSTTCPNGIANCSGHLDALGSARGRIGFAFDRFLIFATGGAAFADYRNLDRGPFNQFSYNATEVGWTVGGGVEYAMTDHLSLKAEYDYYDFGTVTAPAGALNPTPVKANVSAQLAKVGVNYKF